VSEVLVGGLTFPEAPRWRDGTLWFSDFYSGLGWMPDGPPARVVADLSALATGPCNDIDRTLVTGQRGAYACMLGGDDRRTPFVLTNTGSGPAMADKTAGRIETYRVDVPGAGLP
jgi:hypothetical protein